MCQGITGLDANALYPWAMGQDMPTGWGQVRRAETGFRLEQSSEHRQSKIAMQVLLCEKKYYI